MSRGYEVNLEVWGPGILHPTQPSLVWYDPKSNTEIVISDPYDQLLAILDKARERVVERQGDQG